MRLAAKVDRNHAEIVRAFRSVPGVLVKDTSRVGGGFPDIIVAQPQCGEFILHLVEIKDGKKPPSKRKLTQDQQDFIALGWPVHVVTSTDEAFELLGVV